MIELALGDIFDLQQGFAFKSTDFLSKGVPILKIKNVKASGLSLHQLDYVNEAFLDTHRKYIPERGDALISMSGNRLNGSKETWVGKVALFKEEATFLVNQRVGILKNKIPQKANTGFLVYALSSDYWQLRFAQTATSSGGQANLSTSQILRESVLLPSWSDQKAIAHILGTLDDKIELNQKMNQTLEEIAKAIFKSWFVDFDPVRAKAEGRPTGLPTEISDLFPDELVDSEAGEIPKGWSQESLYHFCSVAYGAPFKSKLFNEDGLGKPLVRIRDLPKGKSGVFTEEIHPKGTLIKAGDLVVGMDGEFRCYLWRGTDSWMNQRVCKFIPKKNVPSAFIWFALERPLHFIESTEVATTVIHLGKSDIDDFQFILSSQELLDQFSKFTSPLMERMVIASKEIEVLTELRDTLLPKLISSELRIPDAEKFLEEAGL